MSGKRWLVTCSCGYERECSDATAKLHVVHLGDESVEQLQLPWSVDLG